MDKMPVGDSTVSGGLGEVDGPVDLNQMLLDESANLDDIFSQFLEPHVD